MLRRVLMASGIALLCAGGLNACGGGGKRPPAPAATRPAQKLELGVVAIDARIGSDDVHSSGIVVNGDSGLIVTTAHTVWGARSLKLSTQLGVLHGRIVARAPCDDIALVEAYPRIPGLLSPAPAPAPGPGQLLRSVGRRSTDPDAGAYGLVSIPVRASSGAGPAPVDARLPLLHTAVALDAPLVPEVTGGPVLDQAGRLVGMAVPRASGPGLTLPWSDIRRRLDELRPGPRQVYVGWHDQYRCVSAQDAFARAGHPGFRAIDARLNAPVPATRLPGTEALDG
ncbi:trypsin-like peptidase domain-containing protein [Candidatus Solirubrobacter pratensis]|uniref:trypsin-like peptidase domain-containing protein n=1 Tax=Candidatus Solirubrobacter pratensis TaxID=1298857 RepID=UPI0004133809|nr:trypsin-like peptidase domain-containing protein [Candidatus Solirubrobacter pratensis]